MRKGEHHKEDHPNLRAAGAAFPHTLPIFASFWFLGVAYGVYMNVSGFGFVYPMLMSFTIFGGSLEFVAVGMLLAPFAPVQTLAMTLLIQARHIFYGISMLGRYRGLGRKKPYLIFGLCDETFSINYTARIPEGVDRERFYFFVTLFNQFYWVSGSTIGGLAGSLMSFNTKGIDFVLTAMFTVIFVDYLLKEKQHVTALAGIGVSALCLILFGSKSFMIPAMISILALLALIKKPLEKRGGLE